MRLAYVDVEEAVTDPIAEGIASIIYGAVVHAERESSLSEAHLSRRIHANTLGQDLIAQLRNRGLTHWEVEAFLNGTQGKDWNGQ